MPASSRFDNSLRYRPGDHPGHVAITPEYLLAPIRDLLGGIGLDPCTTPENPTGAEVYYAPPEDGLSLPWDSSSIWVNPPYGKAREPWAGRCVRESADPGKRIVLLIPAATDTRVFQRSAAVATTMLFVRGRLKFGVLRPNRRQVAASHPSVLIGFNVDLAPLGRLGLVVRGGKP